MAVQILLGIEKVDDQPAAGRSLGVDGLVEQGGAQQDDVSGVYGVGDSLHQMAGALGQQDMDLVEAVEMLEIHVYLEGALVVVKVIIDAVGHVVDDNIVALFIENSVD